MEKEPESPVEGSRNNELETLYKQLAQSAARLMVVHEASSILRSSHDPEELAKGLLNVVAEAVFAGSGCVASVDEDELKILAVRGLEEHEADALAENEVEARVWFEVADGIGPRSAADLAESLGLAGEAEDGEPGEMDPGEAEAFEEDSEQLADDSEWPPEDEDDVTAPGEDEPGAVSDDYEEGERGDVETAPAFGLYLPLRVEDETLGVVALGNRVDGQPFSEEDERLADSLCTHLALALDHASLFAERTKRIDQLSVLLQISREITSTLDLEKVLTTICHMLGMVVPNLRTTVALTSGSTVEIRASSDPSLKGSAASKDPFLPVLRWAYGTRRMINTCLDDMKANPDAEGGDLITQWLDREGGPCGLSVLPLEDDQGILGVLAIEIQGDVPPIDDDTEELITVLANQTTVAIRNAELYQRVPMIGMLEPIFGRAKAGVTGRRKLLPRAGVAAALLVVGLFLPIPSWVSGDATIRPATPVPLRAATEGTIEEVLVTEGERVSRGTLLARLRRDELDLELAQVKAASQGARVEAARARSEGDLATFRSRQAELNELFEREKFLLAEIERTDFISPIDGLVLTKDIKLRLGERLGRGETLMDLANLSVMEVEVDVNEKSVDRVHPGRSARIKVHAYPGRTFRGEIVSVAPRAGADGAFRVTVRLSNEDAALRPGMTGRAHLDTPNRPVLRTVLDPIVNRLRLKLWF
jgi:RND family efflux transporter MFP subunit